MIVAGFGSRQDLQAALQDFRSAAFLTESYTPVALETGPAPMLPLLVLAGFILAFCGFFLLQLYATSIAYPLDIGGKPDDSWPAYIVNAFEAGVLVAMACGVLGYFIINRMPQYYHKVDHAAALRRASRDGWFLSIEGDAERIGQMLAPHHPVSVEHL